MDRPAGAVQLLPAGVGLIPRIPRMIAAGNRVQDAPPVEFPDDLCPHDKIRPGQGGDAVHLPAAGLQAAFNRLFANPASTVENLFYFGFLTEQLSRRTGGWLTPPLVGLMYTAHEMSNPEYWYGGANFVLIFVGVTIWAAIYLWRRSAVVIWLGDGLYRLVGSLF